MPQPVKVSDALIEAAREAAPLANRSIAAQVEHWAALGRAIEGALSLSQTADLKRSIQEPPPRAYVAPNPPSVHEIVAEALERTLHPSFGEAVRHELDESPFPTYGIDPEHPQQLMRQLPDGTQTPGRLVGRQFVPSPPAQRRASSAPRKKTARRKG